LLFFLLFSVVALLPVSGWEEGKECGKTIHLLDFTDNGIELDKRALDYLRSGENAKREVIPICIIGVARSGKSEFLSVTTGCNGTFPVGHDQTAKTIGAEMLPLNPKGDGPLYLLIDTEGLDRRREDIEKFLVRFCVLASSHLVYHLSKTIYEKDISRLDDITCLYDIFHKNNIDKILELPSTSWVIEQSTLNNPTEKEVKEVMNGFKKDEDPIRKKTIDRILREEFSGSNPFFIPVPISDATNFTNLPSLSFEQLNEDYRNKIVEVRTIMEKARSKMLTKMNEPLTGSEYTEYLLATLPTVNSINGIFVIHPLIEYILKRAVSSAGKEYDRCMSKLFLPLNEDVWNEKGRKCYNDALVVFEENTLTVDVQENYNAEGHKNLVKVLKQKMSKYREANNQASKDDCDEKIGSYRREVCEIVQKKVSTEECIVAVEGKTMQYDGKFVGTNAERVSCQKRLKEEEQVAIKGCSDPLPIEYPLIIWTLVIGAVVVAAISLTVMLFRNQKEPIKGMNNKK